MSLISDPDFLIHSIRLQYLRNVEDPYGPRLISLDPSYRSNPYVVDAGLADAERWHELALPSSAPPSDDEGNPGRPSRPAGYPAATGLKYTTTILGPSRTGALGLRVNGKRGSISSPRRQSVRRSLSQPRPAPDDTGSKVEPDATPTLPASASPRKADVVRKSVDVEIKVDEASPIEKEPMSTDVNAPSPAPSASTNGAAPPPLNIPVGFIPRFKGAAEMEARRQLRMRNRVPPGGALPTRVAVPAHLNPELSSSSSSASSVPSISDVEDHEAIVPEEDEDEDDMDDDDVAADLMGEDEFDPEFAGSRGTMLDEMSDGMSIMSASQSMTSASDFSVTHSSLPQMGSVRNTSNRLSPVRESHTNEEKSTNVTPEHGSSSPNVDSYFEMVTAPVDDKPSKQEPNKLAVPGPSTTLPLASPSSSSLFVRKPVAPARTGKSALTAMLATENDDTSENPFTEFYSALSGRSEQDSMNVQVFFPHAQKPEGEALRLRVRKDASLEEVLGFALWSYWEEGWQPRIDEGLNGEEDPKWATTCSALGWVLRLAEDDGEVDEDYPVPDRTLKASKVGMVTFAVLKASDAQVQHNRVTESKIQRRRSRIVLKKKKSTELLKVAGSSTGGLTVSDQGMAGMSSSAAPGSMLGSSLGLFPSSFGPSSVNGPPQFLRIRIADTADAGHVSTTIQAHGGMYMAEVLDAVCNKRKLSNPKEYALVLDLKPMKLFIPLDRTVKSLQGKRDLMLIKKSMLQTYGVDMGKRITGRSTDPNASIFKRASDVPEQTLSSVFDYATAYKRFTVYRKVPMLVTRSARLLAIDGGYIHIMPQANKAKNVFESGKTASYDIKSIVAVQQSGKNSATFKLVVPRDAERNKRYEFEAENPKMAAEIVQTIRSLKQQLERSGTNKQSRRSRQVS